MNDNILSQQEYDDFRHFLEEASGIVLGDSKHYLVSSRLHRLLGQYNLETFSDLMLALKKNQPHGLRDRIVDAMTTNETMWFRDIYPFEVLKNTILPAFAKLRERPLRIWSAACSTGQEPYSLSMIVQEYLSSNPGQLPQGVQIVATDISPTVLDGAKAGIYDESSLSRGMSDERRQRFFTKVEEGRYEVRPEIKARIVFKSHNLQQSYATLGKFDVIFCRNVLIYFSSELKTDILERMAATMNPEGYLMLGSSEAPTRYTSAFSMLRAPQAVLYQLK